MIVIRFQSQALHLFTCTASVCQAVFNTRIYLYLYIYIYTFLFTVDVKLLGCFVVHGVASLVLPIGPINTAHVE